ncbi:hypothetical protein BGX28_002382 [Mortierella sp. GBA30]|nr:hypothetical protein BGX28_002382 [Mortierella sp. GBA30]
MPKEQYMIRIGPLEPQESLSPNGNQSLSVFHNQASDSQTSVPSDSSIRIGSLSPTPPSSHSDQERKKEKFFGDTGGREAEDHNESRVNSSGTRKREREQDHDSELEKITSEDREQQHGLRQQEQRRRRQEEMQWERKLAQEIMGISLMANQQDQQQQPSFALASEQQKQTANHDNDGDDIDAAARVDIIADYPPLSSRTKVHLLMKAPAGLVFEGLLPKQMLLLQEDYSVHTIEALSTRTKDISAGITGKKKRGRWPIHHLHILGPRRYPAAPSNPSEVPKSSSLSTHRPILHNQADAENRTLDLDTRGEDIWYQVGSDIPVLSSSL